MRFCVKKIETHMKISKWYVEADTEQAALEAITGKPPNTVIPVEKSSYDIEKLREYPPK